MTVKNRRDYPRSNTLLPFEVRRLTPGERKDIRCRISTDTLVIDDAPPRLKDERLNAWLNMLNAKLDYLIRIASPPQEAFIPLSLELLNISGSGISLMMEEEVAIGDILEIRIVLETYPAKVLYLLGEVVRISETPKKPNTSTVSIQYLNIDETVRNEIIKFDFKKHRERLITRKKP